MKPVLLAKRKALPLGSVAAKSGRVWKNERGKTHKNPFFGGRSKHDNENRDTHTLLRRRCHRAFREEDPTLTAAASPALALRITFQIKPMAHV